MKDLIIVGAGGFGREALYLAKYIKESRNEQWNIKGFIDDNLGALDGVKCDYKVIGTIKNWQVSFNEVFVMGISSPVAKEKVVILMKSKGAHFLTLIHPMALIYENAEIGEGCVVGGRSVVGDCAIVGNFVNLAGCLVGQDAKIGDYSTITGFANVTTAKIGKRVFVGSHAVVLNGRKVGDDVFVCAGSIVFSNVKAGTKVIGNPARRMDF